MSRVSPDIPNVHSWFESRLATILRPLSGDWIGSESLTRAALVAFVTAFVISFGSASFAAELTSANFRHQAGSFASSVAAGDQALLYDYGCGSASNFFSRARGVPMYHAEET